MPEVSASSKIKSSEVILGLQFQPFPFKESFVDKSQDPIESQPIKGSIKPKVMKYPTLGPRSFDIVQNSFTLIAQSLEKDLKLSVPKGRVPWTI